MARVERGSSRREGSPGQPPRLRVVVVSGVAVLVVVLFVVALAVGARSSTSEPGERIGITRRAGAGDGLAVLAVRCPSERVVALEVRRPEGEVAWRILSRKGSIDQHYPVGDEPPLGFEVDVPLDAPLPEGPLLLTLRLSREGPGGVTDQSVFSVDEIPADAVLHRGSEVPTEGFERGALSGVDCPQRADDLDGLTLAFGAAAAAVLITYGMLVARWWHGRRPSGG